MSQKALDTIFAAPAKSRRIKVDVPEDLASRFDALFAERGATDDQRNAVYALAFRRFLEALDRPPRGADKGENNE